MLKRLFLLSLILCFYPAIGAEGLHIGGIESPTYERAEERLSALRYDIRYHVSTLSDLLVVLSYYQDTLLAFLQESGDGAEYHRGMQALAEHASVFRQKCGYACSVVNFYDPSKPCIAPQCISIDEKTCSTAFLNTFKTGKDLTPEERELFFIQEEADYLRDKITEPFILDKTTFPQLRSETLYNFVLLPDGTIRAALECPGQQEYHVRDERTIIRSFAYPNHTILAGSAHQPVLAAGALMVFRHGDKCLYFVSNKSGHFRPTYGSLDEICKQLSYYGIDKNTIVPVPDVDLAQVILKRYDNAQVPISQTKEDASRLFALAHTRWTEAFHSIDRDTLNALSKGDLSVLTRDAIERLNRGREEATYMRSAYHLFDEDHDAPAIFHQFVKHYGKLKDAVKHGIADRIRTEALKVVGFLDNYSRELVSSDIIPADEKSFHQFFQTTVSSMEQYLEHDLIQISDYHELKKATRQLGVLFFLMSQDAKWKGNGFFLNRATARSLFQINEWMTHTHDEYVRQQMQGEIKPEKYIIVSEKISSKLKKCIKHFSLEAPKIALSINKISAERLFEIARVDWLVIHYNLSVSGHKIKPRELLEQIVSGKSVDSSLLELEESLMALKMSTKLVRSAFQLLDEVHLSPEALNAYINCIEMILKGIQSNSVSWVQSEAADMLAFLDTPAWPGYTCVNFVGTSPESFNGVLFDIFEDLDYLVHREHIDRNQLKKIRDRTQKLADLFAILKRSREDQNLPKVCYDSMSRTLINLTTAMNQAIQFSIHSAPPYLVDISPEIRQLATRVLSKLNSEMSVYHSDLSRG